VGGGGWLGGGGGGAWLGVGRVHGGFWVDVLKAGFVVFSHSHVFPGWGVSMGA